MIIPGMSTSGENVIGDSEEDRNVYVRGHILIADESELAGRSHVRFRQTASQ
jgi:hypothetical protein